VDIAFDPVKRRRTLEHRGLDFADAGEVFAGLHVTVEDDRRDYGERRFITAGCLPGALSCWSGHPGVRAAASSP